MDSNVNLMKNDYSVSEKEHFFIQSFSYFFCLWMLILLKEHGDPDFFSSDFSLI